MEGGHSIRKSCWITGMAFQKGYNRLSETLINNNALGFFRELCRNVSPNHFLFDLHPSLFSAMLIQCLAFNTWLCTWHAVKAMALVLHVSQELNAQQCAYGVSLPCCQATLISEKDGGSAVNPQALFFLCSISAADNSIIGNILRHNEVSADCLSRLNTDLTRLG